jgi:hypothetical protein
MRSTDVEPTTSDPRAEARARRAAKRLGALSVLCGAMALLLAVVPAARLAGAGFCALGLFLAVTTLRKGRRRGGGGRELAVAGAVLGCLAAAGVLASLAAFGSVVKRETATPDTNVAGPALSASEITKKVLEEELNVEIGSFSLALEGTGLMESSLTIHVTNKTSSTKTFDIKLEAYGPKGKKLTEDSAYVVNLGGKQTANVAVFKIVNNQLAQQLKNAEFKVTEAVSYSS